MKKAHQQQNKLWPELTSSGVWHTLHRGHGEKEYWAVLIALPLTVILSSWLHIRLCTVPGRRHPFSCCLLVNTQEETLTQLWLYLLLCLSLGLTCPWRALVLEPCLYFGLILCLLLQSFSSAVLWIFCSATEILYFLSSPMQIWRKDCSLSLCIILYILESFMMFLSAFSQGKKAHLIQSFLTSHAL